MAHLQFGEALAHYQRPHVVENATGYHQQPVEVKVGVGIDDGARLFALPSSTSRRRVALARRAPLAARVLDRFLSLRYLAAGEALQERVLALQRGFLQSKFGSLIASWTAPTSSPNFGGWNEKHRRSPTRLIIPEPLKTWVRPESFVYLKTIGPSVSNTSGSFFHPHNPHPTGKNGVLITVSLSDRWPQLKF